MSAKGPDAKKGQVYADVKEKTGRTIKVLSVELQNKNEGRFKARYTYARCQVSGGTDPYTKRPTQVKTIRIDTDRLRDPACYRLDFNPTEVLTGIDVESNAPHAPFSDAATPQAEP